MAIVVPEAVFAPRERSFIFSCMETVPITGYVELSSTKDFASYIGAKEYGFIPTDASINKYQYNQYIPVPPSIAGPGDLFYWRIRNYITGETRTVRKCRLKRPRSHQTNWSFVVGGSCADVGGGSTNLSDECKRYCLPAALSLNPDFICIPGDIIQFTMGSGSLNSSLADFKDIRQDFSESGVDIPIYFSPGDKDAQDNNNNRNARTRLLPCAGAVFTKSQVIRGPQTDPYLQDGNKFNAYYSFGYGNCFFVFINDWFNGTIVSNIYSSDYRAMRDFVETTLKEHRHKYKWCFTFTHTSVDEVDPFNSGGSADTIAENSITRDWLMNLHASHKVTAHFSGHYHGWRVHKHSNGTTYVNCTLGSGVASVERDSWHNDMAFAHVRIGSNENGNTDPDFCKIDIINSGFSGNVGEILNINEDNKGSVKFENSTTTDHRNDTVSIFNSSKRKQLVDFGSEWLYNAESKPSSPVDLVLTERFMKTSYKPTLWHVSLSDSEKRSAWKSSNAPFWGGTVSSAMDTNSGFYACNLGNSSCASSISLPFFWNPGTEISVNPETPTPVYFLKNFDVPDDILVNELQLLYQINDAAYIWINGHLAWYSDGEGSPETTAPYVNTSRPELDPDKIDSSSSKFASDVIIDLEPIPNSKDGSISLENSHSRAPELNYELNGQPIRILDRDVLNSLKKTGNIIAVLLLQGRDIGEASPSVASNLSFDIELTALGSDRSILYAPQIITPEKTSQYNLGTVQITWNINNPPFESSTDGTPEDPYFDAPEFDTSNITYEIEYTDNYVGQATNWYGLKRRISYQDTSYDWKVGKMIKSNSVRIRMRTKNLETEETSDWSVSDQFAINVFELLAPVIVNPIANNSYMDFIVIVLDETLTKNSYHQKVKYTFDYYSKSQNIDWTTIRKELPFGQTIVRWDISGLPQADDYVLRLTAKNFSTCQEPQIIESDQIARRYIYNIKIKQPGSFIIDTKPPKAILQLDSNNTTSQLEHIVNIFASDETTQVESIQLRERDADSILSLGNLDDPYNPELECPTIEQLLSNNPDFTKLIGKSISASPKIQWTFADKSGLRKLEALLTDSGGNTSLQESIRVFLRSFTTEEIINDFIVVMEQRDEIKIDDSTSSPTINVEPSVFEVVYLGTNLGKFYVLEPFSRLLYEFSSNEEINKIIEFNDAIYILTYDAKNDTGKMYRHDSSEPTLLETFETSLSIASGVAVYNKILYIGFKNGELWYFNGLSFSRINVFNDAISTLYADREYLYIGFQNSDSISVYNGTISNLDL